MNPWDNDPVVGGKTSTPAEFAQVYGPAAERAAKTLGVDPKVLLGQWGLETGWGKSIVPGTNNLGNIKDFAGGGVAATDNMTGSKDKYRAYDSPEAFADDFASLIQRKYPNAVGAKDPTAFASALKSGGYAEDPRYVDKVAQATRMAGSTPNPVVAAVGKAVESVIPSAQASTSNPWDNDPVVEAAAKPKQKEYDPTEGMSTSDKVLAGIGMGMSKVGRAVGQAVGLSSQADIDEATRTDAALANTTAGKVGNFVGQAAAVAPAMLIPGAGTYAGASAIGAGVGALTTEGGLKERAQGAAFGALGGAGGKALGDAAGAGVRYLTDKRAATQAINAGRDAAAVQARGAGYTLPPSDTNPTVVNELLNGLSGKIKTAQVASARNQDVTNVLARRSLGLPEDVPLTADALNTVRNQAGQAYNAVRGAGTIAPDAAYQNGLTRLASQYQGAAQSFPGLAKNEVADLAAGLNVPSIESSSAVDMIKVLREGADKAYRGGDKGLGKANKEAAQELEGLLERHLQANGAPDAVKQFQDARKLIAKTYTVQKGLNEATGDVSASAIASAMQKGKPITDELKTIAEANLAFPKATQTLKEAPKALSPLDFATAVISGAATGNPLMAATLVARPAVRSTILSKVYQSMAGAQKYEPNVLARAIESGLKSPQLRNYAPAGMGLASARAADIPRVEANLDLLNEGGR